MADHLAFVVQPSQTPTDQVITPAVQVALMDASGKTVTTRLQLRRHDGQRRVLLGLER